MRSTLFHLVAFPWWAFGGVLLGLAALFGLLRQRWREQPERQQALDSLFLVLLPALLIYQFVTWKWGALPVHAYGLMLMLAFLVGLLVARKRAPAYGVDPEGLIDLTLYILVAAIIGSRLLYVILDLAKGSADYAQDPWLIFKTWKGGLSFHGGLLGGVIAGVLFARRHQIPPWRLADVLAPGLGLAYAVARVGCLLNGCCYGRPTDLPWAIVFVDPYTHEHSPPSHPTQIYSMIGGLTIFGLLLLLGRVQLRRGLFEGLLACSFLILYSIERAIVEIWRAGVSAVWVPLVQIGDRPLGLTQAQLASLLIALVALGVLIFLGRRSSHAPALERRAPPHPPASGGTPPKPRKLPHPSKPFALLPRHRQRPAKRRKKK